MLKRITAFISAAVFAFVLIPRIKGNCEEEYESIDELLQSLDEPYIAVYEANTDTLIGGKNEEEKCSISHLTKLMTAYIAYLHIENGQISFETKLSTSQYANSMQGTQIWLDIGEEISVDELIKAITISNANDAAVVLAEGCCGSEESFVKEMNSQASRLGMDNTVFADCTGISDKNISTAKDICILTGELMRKNVFSQYYTMRIAEVGYKGSQLVTQNRLIDNYKGICGYKSCYGDDTGEMLCVGSKQRDMAVCAVLLGGDDNDSKFSDAKAVMNYTFTHYEVYYPEIPDEAAADIPVIHGQKETVKAGISDIQNILIERGTYRQIYTKLETAEEMTAPVKSGDKIGELSFINDDGVILVLEIEACEDIKEMNFLFALKTMLCNLFNIV